MNDTHVAAMGGAQPVGRAPILEVEGLTRHYGSVVALSDASFTLHEGEVTALVGDNGAGKSTLVKCISGSLKPTAGTIKLDGQVMEFTAPGQARDAGIETVYQQLALVEPFNITENLFLGREVIYSGWRGLLGILDRKDMRRRAMGAIQELPARFPNLDAAVSTMSGGQRQVVAMTRGAFWKGRLLLLDEPTAALGVRESQSVLEMIRHLIEQRDMAMMVISHNMEHVWATCDRILVMRQGRLVADLNKHETTKNDVVAHITGLYDE